MVENPFPGDDDRPGLPDPGTRDPQIDLPADDPVPVPTDPPVYIPTDVPVDAPGDGDDLPLEDPPIPSPDFVTTLPSSG
jgi:hypothetical protein